MGDASFNACLEPHFNKSLSWADWDYKCVVSLIGSLPSQRSSWKVRCYRWCIASRPRIGNGCGYGLAVLASRTLTQTNWSTSSARIRPSSKSLWSTPPPDFCLFFRILLFHCPITSLIVMLKGVVVTQGTPQWYPGNPTSPLTSVRLRLPEYHWRVPYM